MTRSDIFTKAHRKARIFRTMYNSYKAAFSAGLKAVYKEIKSEKAEPFTDSEAKEIAQNIIKYLGANKFFVMTGAKIIGYSTQGDLKMKLTTNKLKAQYMLIKYNPGRDDFTMTFSRVKNLEYQELKEIKGLYCDDLQRAFTINTGLYTRFGQVL